MKNDLIKAIHWLERYTGKRMAGLIFEHSFFRRYLPTVFSKSDSLCSGWFFVRGGNAAERHWFKLTLNDKYELSATEKEFTQRLGDVEHKFFLIQAKVELKTDPLQRPVVIVDVSELGHEKSESAKVYKDDIERNLQLFAAFAAPPQSSITDYQRYEPTPESDYTRWLEGYEEKELKELFASRCLLNSCFSNPVDVDGIVEIKQGNIGVIEFKRKNPAKACLKTDYGGMAEELDTIDSSSGKNKHVGSHYSDLSEAEAGWCKKNIPCYGLDMSHFRTVKLCKEKKLSYLYVVWDWTGTRGTDTKPLDDLTANLTFPDLKPKQKFSAFMLDLAGTSPDGVTNTSGAKSGAYTTGIRIQVTYDKQRFIEKKYPVAANTGSV